MGSCMQSTGQHSPSLSKGSCPWEEGPAPGFAAIPGLGCSRQDARRDHSGSCEHRECGQGSRETRLRAENVNMCFRGSAKKATFGG